MLAMRCTTHVYRPGTTLRRPAMRQCSLVPRRPATICAVPARPSGGCCSNRRLHAARRLLGTGGRRRCQATVSNGTNIASLRSQMYAIHSATRGRRATAEKAIAAQIAQITRLFPAVAATSCSVHELADLCRMLARVQPRRGRGKGRRLKDERWYDAALDRCLALLLSPTPKQDVRGLSTLAHALSLLPMQFTARDIELVDVLGNHVAASATDALERRLQAEDHHDSCPWDEQAVARVMSALAKLSVRHESAMLALSRLAHSLEPSLSPQATSTVLWSLAVLNCADEPYIAVVDSLSKRFRTAAAQQLQRTESLPKPVRQHSACANDDERPTMTSRRIRGARKKNTAATAATDSQWASLRTTVVAAWSLTVLDRLSFPVLRSVFAAIGAAEKRGEFKQGKVNDIVLCQLHQVILAIRLGHVHGPPASVPSGSRKRSHRRLSTSLGLSSSNTDGRCDFDSESSADRPLAVPDKLAERCRATFRRTNRKVGRSSQYSPTAAAVEKALTMARPECKVEREQLLHDCGYSVDLLLRKERIAVEVDGKVHYCRRGPWEHEQFWDATNAVSTTLVDDAARSQGLSSSSPDDTIPRRKLGRTALKHRQIEAMGWRVVSVPWWEWESLQTQDGGASVRYLARRTCGITDNGGNLRT